MIRYSVIAMALLSLSLFTACENKPKRDYDAFKARSQSLRENICLPASERPSQFSDLRGSWLLNAKLTTGTKVDLRILIEADTWPEQLEEGETFTFSAKIWLGESDPQNDDPLLVVDPPPTIDSEGRFILTANPLTLELATGPVEAVVNLESITLAGDAFCGDAKGSVVQPLTIDLEGSTFGAKRDELLNLDITEVPTNCGCDVDEEPIEEPMGGETPEEVERPELPDLTRSSSAPADLTGHWLVNIKLPVPLPLKLWASLIYTPPADPPIEGAEGGVVDGTLRREADTIDAEPIARFSSPISSDGIFEIWMPGFSLMGVIPVEGDLLIGAVIIPPDTDSEELIWCGKAAGTASASILPEPLDLLGTTLFAASWVPGSGPLEDQASACPDE